MLGLGRFTKSVSDATIGTAIVLAHVALADYLAKQHRPIPPKHRRDRRVEHE